ncbi:MAG: ABC transporter substrate-binding protein [Acidimicrobiia bacterium]|nr:ABC transporter substrate-binding protein [Acidimicrobiia bacterium]
MTKVRYTSLLAAVLMLILAACGGAEPGDDQEIPDAPTTEAAATEEPADTDAPATTAPEDTEAATSAPGSTTAESEPDDGAGGEAPDEIVIGIPASLTGQYEALGRQGLDGLNMFANWVNEEKGGIDVGGTLVPVRVVFGDDRSDLDTSLRLYEQLVQEDEADFMFASYSSSLTLAQAPLAEQLDMVTMAWGASSDDIWNEGFTRTVGVYTPASQYDHTLLEFVTSTEPIAETIAIVHKDDPFTVAEAEGARAKAEELGLEVVFYDAYPAQAADLSPILTQAAGSEPDVMLVVAHFQDGALAARQMTELGIDVAASSFGSGAATTDWWDELGEAAQGTFGPTQWEPNQSVDPAAFEEPNWVGPQITPSEYATMYEEEFGYDPDYRGGLVFHSGLALMAAIEEAGTIETEAVTEAIKGLDIQTLGGGFRVDPETLIQVGHDMLTVQWQDGEKVIVTPAEAATGEAIYPANE